MLSLTELKRHIAAYPAFPPRTYALEQRIRIGVGFHEKWYRSQKEHQLGWLIVQECQERRKDNDPGNVSPRKMWNRLNCSPSMYWYAEVSGVAPQLLDAAEEAAKRAAETQLAEGKKPQDGPPHGKLMKQVLPWEIIEEAVLSCRTTVSVAEAEAMALEAFERLVDHPRNKSNYGQLRDYLP